MLMDEPVFGAVKQPFKASADFSRLGLQKNRVFRGVRFITEISGEGGWR
jgi:hypothetical protein